MPPDAGTPEAARVLQEIADEPRWVGYSWSSVYIRGYRERLIRRGILEPHCRFSHFTLSPFMPDAIYLLWDTSGQAHEVTEEAAFAAYQEWSKRTGLQSVYAANLRSHRGQPV